MKTFIIGLASFSLLVLSDSAVQAKNFHLTQEQSTQNGVLISRPNPLDEKIIFLLQENNIQNLDQVAAWLKGRILYQKDPGPDQWSDAAETLERKFGDCEDFAFLTAKILKILGYDPQIMAFMRDGRAHATCVFQSGGQYHWFDNGELKKTSTRDIEAFVTEISRQYHLASIWKLNSDQKSWRLAYKS